MRRPKALALLAAVAAGVTGVATAVTGGAGAAMAANGADGAARASRAAVATPAGRTRGPASYTRGSAGYVTGGRWRFRYAGTALKIPACQTDPGDNAGASVSLSAGPRYLASIAVVCGGGADSIGYLDRHFGTGAFHLSPAVGDVVKIGIYRKAGHDYFAVTDLTSGSSQTVTVATPPAVVYRQAALLASIDTSKVRAPARDVRLWTFRDGTVTSYGGQRGAVFGPWITREVVSTTDGTASGSVVMSAGYPFGSGHCFTIWLRH
jgi:hypothetical protein